MRKKTKAKPKNKSPGGKRAVPVQTISRPELLVDGTDFMYRHLVHSLLAFLDLHSSIRDGIASSVGLGGIQHTILQSVQHLGAREPVNVRNVADHLQLSASFITIETTKLQQMGLIEKERSTSDRRMVSLKITKKGADLFARVAPLQRTIGDVQFSCLSEKQFRELVPMIDKLIASSREALQLLDYLRSGDSKSRLVQISDMSASQ